MTKKLVVKADHDIEIVNTLEVIYGTCAIEPDVDDPRGWSYTCAGTDINWDTQETVQRSGQNVFVDEEGNEYLENEIELIDVSEEDEDDPEAESHYRFAENG